VYIVFMLFMLNGIYGSFIMTKEQRADYLCVRSGSDYWFLDVLLLLTDEDILSIREWMNIVDIDGGTK